MLLLGSYLDPSEPPSLTSLSSFSLPFPSRISFRLSVSLGTLSLSFFFLLPFSFCLSWPIVSLFFLPFYVCLSLSLCLSASLSVYLPHFISYPPSFLSLSLSTSPTPSPIFLSLIFLVIPSLGTILLLKLVLLLPHFLFPSFPPLVYVP